MSDNGYYIEATVRDGDKVARLTFTVQKDQDWRRELRFQVLKAIDWHNTPVEKRGE